jgi:hypothetical protein
MSDSSKVTPIRADISIPEASPAPAGPLPPGGGGPYNPDMEARVAKLESDVGHIRSDMSEIKNLLARLAPRIDEMYGRQASAATQADIANLRTEIERRPTRRQSVVDFALIVGVIGGLLTIGSKLAH